MQQSYQPLKGYLKNGDECFYFRENKSDFKLLDFWKWSVSDLLSNATRGRLAEFIVAAALGVDMKIPRNEWNPYDLIYQDKIKIEVKSASFIQSWTRNKYSNIIFSVRPSHFLDMLTNRFHKEVKRHADVYIFCLLNHKDKQTIDPLNLDQWQFYVLSTKEIEDYNPGMKSISLKKLQKLTQPAEYSEIKNLVLSKCQF